MHRSLPKNRYKTSVDFQEEMIAPCGMNCGACSGYMRQKNSCPGCRSQSDGKPAYCQGCIVINCSRLAETESKFCYECPKYPCARLKSLEKRYSTKYNTSFFGNLAMIRDKGIDAFLAFETERRTCPQCGATLCVHRPACLECGLVYRS